MNYIFFAFIGAFLLSISDVLSKYALNNNVSNLNFIFWSHGIVYIACIILLLVLCLFIRPQFLLGDMDNKKNDIQEIIKLSNNKKTRIAVFLSGIIAFSALICIIYSFKISDNIGYTSAIISTTCLFTLLFSVLFLGSNIEIKGVIGCLLIIAGIVMISRCSNIKRH
jgi:drug/metabolite transporter (DMT)-like permease